MNNKLIDKWLDIMATLGCIAVVCLHVDRVYWNPHVDHWWVSNVIESLFYFGAPVFFMISGCTLIDYRRRYDTKTFFKRRVLRTVIPFIFWSSLGIIVFHYEGLTLCRFLSSLLNYSSMRIYWFFIQLFALYLVIPVFGALSDKKKWFGYIIVCSVLTIAVPDFISRLQGRAFMPLLRNPCGGGAVPLALIGYWIGHFEVERRYRLVIYLLGLVGLLLHYFGTMALTVDEVSTVFKGYMNLPSLFYSTAVFLWVRNHDWKQLPKGVEWMVRQIRSCSFGIYLLHGFVVYKILPVIGVVGSSIPWRIFGAFLIVPALIVVIRFLRKLPLGTFVLP